MRAVLQRIAQLGGVAAVGALSYLSAAAPAGGATTWQRAPIFGGDIRSLAIDPRDANVVLAGSSAGQIYRSRDGGETWANAGAELPLPGWVVAALTFDSNRPGRVWAGLWGLWGGGQVAYSDDLGASWAQPGRAFAEHQIYALATVPGSAGWLYAGTRAGVLRSNDAGVTWVRATAEYPDIVNVSSLMIDPMDPRSVIAGTWRRAYKSTDDGVTWRPIFRGMVEDTEVFSLNPVVWRPGEIWASTCGWVYRSSDGGESWARFQKGLDEKRTPAFRVLADGGLLAGTVAGAYVSRDHGESWSRKTPADVSVLAIAQSAARPQRLLLGTEGSGVWISDDGGESFRASSQGLTNVRVMALAKNGPEIIAGVNHAGPSSGVYSSFDRATSFSFTPETLPTLLDLTASSGRLYAATEQGLFVRDQGSWSSVAKIGPVRIEQVLTAGKRLVVRAPKGFFELHGKDFVAVPYKRGAPRSAALFDDALWVTDAAGLYRFDQGGAPSIAHAVATPVTSGRLAHLGGRVDALLLSGSDGAWVRSSLRDAWRQIAVGPTRVFETSDPAYPALLVSGDRVSLWNAGSGELEPFEVSIPPRDIASVLIDGAKIYLGTSGYGLLIGDRPAATAAAAP
ncbi:MAG: hypothetical protein ABI609_08310 [Acidobacteriota bacterium]